jgi:2-C-methyl-D-erythritol 2,4-cyclodiphosphate synthase
MTVGIGFDVHQLVAGRKLILGGIHIPHYQGLAGHSDADVLVHALCDALLGAAGLGDIGRHFPDGDPQYKNIYSIELLKEVGRMLTERAFEIVNIDATVIAQQPKLAPYASDMKSALAAALSINTGKINIKATTTEGLGIIGKQSAMAAMCAVMLDP